MRHFKSCRNCLKSRPIPFTGDVLCRYKGVVSADFACMRHKYIPNLKSFKELNYKCIDCANFSTKRDYVSDSADYNSVIGLCRVFSVRCYDGAKKSACSKFVMRAEIKNRIPKVRVRLS